MKTVKYLLIILSFISIFFTLLVLAVGEWDIAKKLLYPLGISLFFQIYLLMVFLFTMSRDWLKTLKELQDERWSYGKKDRQIGEWIKKIGEHEAIKLIEKK